MATERPNGKDEMEVISGWLPWTMPID
jgi:hypothetical protein